MLALLGVALLVLALSQRERAEPEPRQRRKNPRSRSAAEKLSAEFHGTPALVQPVPARARRLPAEVVILGEVPALEYIPPESSQRGAKIWRHESGDTGDGDQLPERPLLAVDPRTRRPLLLPGRSKMTFDPHRGLVG